MILSAGKILLHCRQICLRARRDVTNRGGRWVKALSPQAWSCPIRFDSPRKRPELISRMSIWWLGCASTLHVFAFGLRFRIVPSLMVCLIEFVPEVFLKALIAVVGYIFCYRSLQSVIKMFFFTFLGRSCLGDAGAERSTRTGLRSAAVPHFFADRVFVSRRPSSLKFGKDEFYYTIGFTVQKRLLSIADTCFPFFRERRTNERCVKTLKLSADAAVPIHPPLPPLLPPPSKHLPLRVVSCRCFGQVQRLCVRVRADRFGQDVDNDRGAGGAARSNTQGDRGDLRQH